MKKVKGSGSSGSSSSAGAGVVVSRAQEIPEWDADPLPTLSARGIDAALSLLSVADTPTDDNAEANKLERHPERRVKAAYAAFEKRRLAEMEDEGNANSNANSNASGKGKSGGGLRRTQRIDLVRREFEKSSENPWNQVYVPVGMAAAGRREVLKGVRREQEGLLRER